MNEKKENHFQGLPTNFVRHSVQMRDCSSLPDKSERLGSPTGPTVVTVELNSTASVD